MDVYEIERHLRNQPDFLYIDGSLIDILIEKLKEVSYKYEQLTEVLDNWNYDTDPEFLEEELHDLANDIANWKDENKALQDEINVLKETFANS
jgi:chromosome segregation ATPase